MSLTFGQRNNPKNGNLLFSYGVSEDLKAADFGYAFFGAGRDHLGGEVHVFRMIPLPNVGLTTADFWSWLWPEMAMMGLDRLCLFGHNKT